MMQRLMFRAALAVPLMTTACMRQASTASIQPSISHLAVRFVVPTERPMMANSAMQGNAQLAADRTYEGLAGDTMGTSAYTNESDMVHVALWGGPFDGDDMTNAPASLEPGAYTFAFLDPDTTTAVQGWINVNAHGTEMIDFLQKWRNSIPEQKQWLAYDLEVQGKLKGNDADVFADFAKQLRAYDRLAQQLDASIVEEMRARAESQQTYDEFLRNAEVLILPGGDGLFHPTTRAAFTSDDLDRVRSGETMSKMLLLADYEDAQWKLRRVNNVYNELGRCKSVLSEEVDRLQRRKRYYTLTDHLYHHDRAFVENEMRMQQTLSAIDRLNEQISELRNRRMAFAFISELVASSGALRPLDMEQHDLMRERVVLDARKHRLELLFDETEEDSPKRIAIQRNRQEVIRAIEAIDEQLDRLAEARIALQTLRKSCDVIHRQGDYRLIASSFVDQDVPFHVREAIEREAIMTVRLEPTDRMFVPRKSTVAYGPVMQSPVAGHPMTETTPIYEPTHAATAAPAATPPTRSASTPYNTTASTRQQESNGEYGTSSHASRTAATQGDTATSGQQQAPKPSPHSPSRSSSTTSTRSSAHSRPASTAYDVQDWSGPDRSNTGLAAMRNDNAGNHAQARNNGGTGECGWVAKLLVPPCWFVGSNDQSARLASTRHYDGGQSGSAHSGNGECGWIAKLLVPPCWFVSGNNHGAELASMRNNDANAPSQEHATEGCQCNFLLKLLVPPCWFVGN